ncbi:16S rRNA (uracil(1498)-N(3))-methyltransferase [Solemya velum gill symbiont]|uniref:16S rRNA (uracil(1498)-N(3))-methyltransferase n=1 Tax=Solemya velum gill symbiont TaxID=2340 RepID=UPI00099780B1|nr:16S rRNA (uracil(1498)-N(3))-methyltransferase [Solemya velum gill symbiont]OOY99790.1 16S rRNA (uracil(1498)-N(3))-methyltransferase [Solemya velum gill symbiont]OOZ01977.1 16S rRNA (uracil(1498)-N(3))-methyltransferase [Solemya velum gill symbiont]OOZ04299.1 16S rRNA (uracil(1498)-N(3))-methyltransferase [Solemya velum gill symbiont]OOZ06557.1 16S rRNA (uracil(1498)-N(3))-methyltransferase [Solemya velum gill symbiont]OOZ08742.1 16S rRNA (uracil(1498)-N(3))-methyltransferase [Solemya velu
MTVPRIFIDCELQDAGLLELPREAAHHLSTVLRRKPGDRLTLFNGNGYEYNASIESLEKRHVNVRLDGRANSCHHRESPLHIHVGLALTKGQKMDLAIQKLVELGVNRITPLVGSRSVVKLDQKREASRLAHWHGVIISACEQSGRCIIPEISDVCSIDEWPGLCMEDMRLTLDPRASVSMRELTDFHSVALAVGPEGGFSNDEVMSLVGQGVQSVRLGNRILRAETAPLAAVSVLQTLHGDFC